MLDSIFRELFLTISPYLQLTLYGTAGIMVLTNFLSDKQTLQDYFRHWYLIGKTGCGKSTTIRDKLLIPWIDKGYGAMVIETKDKSTIDDILNSIPEKRHDDVIVFDVLDMAAKRKWIGINLLEDNYNLSTSKTLITGEVLSILKRHFGKNAIQARSEDYFRNAILASLEMEDSTIIEVYRMLSNEQYRKNIIPNITNEVVRSYYENDFFDDPGALAAPLNKLRTFLSIPEVINVLSQPRGINIRRIIEDQKILLVLLPKGIIGEDASRLLASTFLSKVQLAAQSRADMPKPKRFKKPFMVVCDEFQDYANASFNAFLEQSRAFGVSLVIAHQLLHQKGINRDIISSILGNIGNYLIFRCGPEDSRVLSEIVKDPKAKKQKFTEDFLENMDNHTYIEKITAHDKMQEPKHVKNNMPKFLGEFEDKLREKSLLEYGVDEGYIKQIINSKLKIKKVEAKPIDKKEGVF